MFGDQNDIPILAAHWAETGIRNELAELTAVTGRRLRQSVNPAFFPSSKNIFTVSSE
jgi:hypothetical protein